MTPRTLRPTPQRFLPCVAPRPEPAPGHFHGADQDVGHAPRQILAGRGDLHDVTRSGLGRIEVADQRQRANLAVRGEVPQQPIDLVLDLTSARDDGRRVASAPRQRRRERSAEDGPFDGGRRCRRVVQHPLRRRCGLVEPVCERLRRRRDALDDQPQRGVADPTLQQLEHLVGTRGVAHRPLQVGNPCDAPPHQIQFAHAIRLECAEDLFGFGCLALPQQGPGQKLAGDQPAVTVHRGARQAFTEGDVGQRDGVLRGGREKLGIGGHVAVERQFGEPDALGRSTDRLLLHRMEQFALEPAGGGPAQAATDHLPVERVGKPHIQARWFLDDNYQSALFDALHRLDADQPRQGVQGQRFGKGQQPQGVRFIFGQLFDAGVQQRCELGGDDGSTTQLPDTAHLPQGACLQRALDQVPDV